MNLIRLLDNTVSDLVDYLWPPPTSPSANHHSTDAAEAGSPESEVSADNDSGQPNLTADDCADAAYAIEQQIKHGGSSDVWLPLADKFWAASEVLGGPDV